MTFLERLQSHKGSLLRIKSELYWYDRGGWDRSTGRICLLMDAAAAAEAATTTAAAAEAAATTTAAARLAALTAAYLLIDGSPQWVWVAEADMEVLEKP